jgi:hypothetical protein
MLYLYVHVRVPLVVTSRTKGYELYVVPVHEGKYYPGATNPHRRPVHHWAARAPTKTRPGSRWSRPHSKTETGMLILTIAWHVPLVQVYRPTNGSVCCHVVYQWYHGTRVVHVYHWYHGARIPLVRTYAVDLAIEAVV